MCSSKSNIAPDSWKLQRIGQLAETYAGGTPPRNASGMFGGTIPWVKSAELNQREILDTDEKLTELGYQSSSVKWVPESTPLIAMYGATAGVVSWLKIRAVTNQAVLAVLPRNEDTDARWLYWALSFYSGKLLASVQGSGQPNLNKALIKQLEVICPPLPEQRRIAEILDTADEAIRQAERVIAKLQAVKAGLLHDLLTRGLDEHGHLRDPQAHPEQFKDSPLGRIPREWAIRPLELCVCANITYGIVQAGPHFEDGIPYIRTGDMSGDRLTVDGLLRTSKQIAESYKRSEVHTGEIVCAIRATVGKVLELPSELDGANLTQGTARIAPLPSINSHFLLWMLRSDAVQRQFDMAVKGTTFREITLEALRKLEVPLPVDRKEQDRIATILDTHDARIRAEEAELAKLHQVKRGLMDDLLTGRVRVT
jgi:type I restriction enzyme S subunit